MQRSKGEANVKKRETVVKLQGFVDLYRNNSSKTAESIARGIFEHCLWYCLRPGSVPTIFVLDDNEAINLNELYDKSIHSSALNDSF